MWGFQQKPAALSKELARCLAQERGLSAEGATSLSVMKKRGHYAGRTVTYFRVYDRADAKVAGLNPSHFSDLDAFPILYQGHLEKDGAIVLSR